MRVPHSQPMLRVLLCLACGAAVLLGASAAEAAAPVNLSPPSISGRPVIGHRLTAGTGRWDRSGYTFSYQWYRCASPLCQGDPIASATNSAYVPQPADYGDTLVVVVTATGPDGSTSAHSDQSGIVGFYAGPRRGDVVKAGSSLWVGVQVSGSATATITLTAPRRRTRTFRYHVDGRRILFTPTKGLARGIWKETLSIPADRYRSVRYVTLV